MVDTYIKISAQQPTAVKRTKKNIKGMGEKKIQKVLEHHSKTQEIQILEYYAKL